VKWYSSGMYVRLGFSIAAHLDADVLLLDEVLAVGDATFHEQCLGRVAELKRGGRTIVFISHDLAAVERLCDRVLLLERGQVKAEGAPREIVATYQRLAIRYGAEDQPVDRRVATGAARAATVKRVVALTSDGIESGVFRTGEPLTLRLDYRGEWLDESVAIDVWFESLAGQAVCVLTTEGTDAVVAAGAGSAVFECEALGLRPGMYFINAAIRPRGAPAGAEIDRRHCALLRVDPGKDVRGAFYMPYHCKVLPEASPGQR
jgi:hypothetical protein